jgi:hypothetical protein
LAWVVLIAIVRRMVDKVVLIRLPGPPVAMRQPLLAVAARRLGQAWADRTPLCLDSARAYCAMTVLTVIVGITGLVDAAAQAAPAFAVSATTFGALARLASFLIIGVGLSECVVYLRTIAVPGRRHPRPNARPMGARNTSRASLASPASTDSLTLPTPGVTGRPGRPGGESYRAAIDPLSAVHESGAHGAPLDDTDRPSVPGLAGDDPLSLRGKSCAEITPSRCGSGAGQVLGLVHGLSIEERRARLGAGPTDRLADCAVAVMVSVPSALLGAALAGVDAGLEQVVDDELVPLRRTRKNSRRDVAYVCARDAQGGAHA